MEHKSVSSILGMHSLTSGSIYKCNLLANDLDYKLTRMMGISRYFVRELKQILGGIITKMLKKHLEYDPGQIIVDLSFGF